MKNKISLLIYKKLDNKITEKELKLLNKYLEKEEYQKEYQFIKNIYDELTKDNIAPLPENFKESLREKLTDYNINKDSIKNKVRFFPVPAVAGLAVAMFIAIFAVNHNPAFISYNTKTQTVADDNRILEESNINSPISRSLPSPSGEELNDNIASDMVYECIVITANCDIALLKSMNPEAIDSYTYKISVSHLKDVKELLKDIQFEIQNETEDNLNKDFFLLKIVKK